MGFVIVTTRSLLWLILSLIALLLMLSSFMSAAWLKGPLREDKQDKITYTPTVGIYTRCTYMKSYKNVHCGSFALYGFATDEDVFPAAWKATMFFIALGLSIMAVTVFCGIVSCCFQSIFKKSIFTISGATQACAGISYIMGIMVYPIAWTEPRIHRLCSSEAAAFYPGSCSLGWGLYAAILATGLTFVCACLSVLAERATSSDKVQNQIDEGRVLICLA